MHTSFWELPLKLLQATVIFRVPFVSDTGYTRVPLSSPVRPQDVLLMEKPRHRMAKKRTLELPGWSVGDADLGTEILTATVL